MQDYKSTVFVSALRIIAFIFLSGTVFVDGNAQSSGEDASTSQSSQSTPLGPLKVHPTNPRYFTDGSKNADGTLKAVYLTGSHTWNNLQDLGAGDPPPVFDYTKYLDYLERYHHNFIRLWHQELPRWWEEESLTDFICIPHPWPRTGPGMASDGKPKFDLNQFDEGYFQRLRERVIAARERGMYVAVMLFEAWGLRFVRKAWETHPFNLNNNVSGIDGDLNERGPKVYLLTGPQITAAQEAYVRKVIDTVNDLDNVLYEICNENDTRSTQWQYHMIRFIKDYEATKPFQHPVGMTPDGFGGDDDTDRIWNSPADWVSPTPDRFDYKADPPAADGSKVVISDTDHLWGVGGDVAWVWKTFLRGIHPIFMDPYDGLIMADDPQWEPVRYAMGQTRLLAERINLATMTPQSEIASTGYCLADLGKEYVVYLPSGGEAEVDLSAAKGELAVEWIHPVEGNIQKADPVAGGAKQTFKAPFNGEAVLHLKIALTGVESKENR